MLNWTRGIYRYLTDYHLKERKDIPKLKELDEDDIDSFLKSGLKISLDTFTKEQVELIKKHNQELIKELCDDI